jgi:hypothetical protein
VTETEDSESTVKTPSIDCDYADRPPSPPQDADPPGDVERYIYPDRPDSLSSESTVRTYVRLYERAHRLNALRREYESSLTYVTFRDRTTWVHEAPERAAIGRVKYTYSYRHETDGEPIASDSVVIYASYYIDDSMVLRAVEEGDRMDDSELNPDPVETGQPVECF